jgi:hypothetical protein
MVQTLLSGKPMKRKYFVSESWSQATVITKDEKLGIMIDPTPIHLNWDFRNFGDMFFDRKTDPMETRNKIKDNNYQQEIKTLRSYYDEFVGKIPATGKDEVVAQSLKK